VAAAVVHAVTERFSTHPEPVWKDRATFIINAELPEPDRFEQLWTRQLSNNTFQVCCIPFFLYDVALGDVVETHPQGSRTYVLSRVVKPSGRYVFRVHFKNRALGGEVADELGRLGALLEWSSPSLLAVDAADLAHAQRVANHLQDAERENRLMYETGKLA
jgi:Domain of unknown function (DUF4265)